METGQAERRSEQRFPLRLPLLVKSDAGQHEESSLTRDVSAGGVFFYLDTRLAEGTPVEIVLTLPDEITLTENIPVRCNGKVIRVVDRLDGDYQVGIAVAIEQYEFTSCTSFPVVRFM